MDNSLYFLASFIIVIAVYMIMGATYAESVFYTTTTMLLKEIRDLLNHLTQNNE